MELKAQKVVSALPDPLEASTIYFVRVGAGFDLFVTNQSGTIVAYGLNVNAQAIRDFQGQYNSARFALTYAAALGVNWDNGNVQAVTMTGSPTVTFSNAVGGGRYLLILRQDATGGRTITWPTIKWQGGTAPTLTATGGKTDLITLIFDGTDWFGAASLNF